MEPLPPPAPAGRHRPVLQVLALLGAAFLPAAPPLRGAPLPAGPSAPAAAPAPGAGPTAAPGGRTSLNVLQESGQRFQPHWSPRGMVVSQDHHASTVGAALLRRGGNAVDGAVATAFALAVTLPQAGNLGGGGFLVLWLPGDSPAGARGCLDPSSPRAAGPQTAALKTAEPQDGGSERRAPGPQAGGAEQRSAVPMAGPDPASRGPELRLGPGYAVAINFRETAPAAAHPDLFRRPDGSVDRAGDTRSLGSTAVPGSVAGLLLAHRCYGRLPLPTVLAPAIALAERGVPVGRELADSLAAALPLLSADPTSRALFLRPTADQPGQLRPLRPGEVLRQPLLAATLRRIARHGERGFYQGPVAESLVRLMEARGGLIRAGDLRSYRAELVRPQMGRFRGHPLLTMPPPGGGLTLLQLLALVEPFDLGASGPGSAASAHQLSQAMNLAYRDRNRWLGDPQSMLQPPPNLLDPAYLDQLRRTINQRQHRPAASLAAPPPPRREGVNTTHLSVADRQGGLVALTTTLNFAYGNGVTVPGAGFLLNNEMDDFTAAPGVPNAYGLVQGEANAILPGRRPLSSMAPTLVFRPDGGPWLATGSPGGSRIITTVAQVLLQRIIWGSNLATAVAAPRLHSQLWPDQLSIEEGFSADTRILLEAMGHSLQRSPAMGAANSVEVLMPVGSGSLGAMDPRRGQGGAVAEGW